MPYYGNRRYDEYDNAEVNRLPSGLFFTAARVEHMESPPNIPRDYIEQKEVNNHDEINYANFVVPKYNTTKTGKEIYLPLLEVSVEVEVVATIAWSKLTQTFTNRSTKPIQEATYCMPLYDKSTVTAFVCTIGSDKILRGTVKPKETAKAEFKEAVAKQQVAALLEEHTPEVFETSVGNIPAETTVKVEISYITELKADLGGDGVQVTIPTSVAPRYGAMPSSMGVNSAKSLAVPEKNGLQIKIQVSSPVAITRIESRTHPVSIEMGSHGTRVTKDIKDFSKKQESQGFDPKKAAATLSDRNACLGKDFVLLIQAKDGQLLGSRAITEPHPTKPNSSALMVSINLRDFYTPNVVSPKIASEIIFVADKSGSMRESMDALKTAMKFFLKSLPNNCIFNICSFGSAHKLMWHKSRPYNQENVDIALDYVATNFSANMGGTEILNALQNVVKTREPSTNTEIITLTDGGFWNAKGLFEFIESQRSSWPNTRFFCLGIGEAVSHNLVAGIGKYGGGLAEVVATDSSGDWMQSVIGMLRAALTPSSWTVDVTLDGLSISSKESENKGCIQAPHRVPDFHVFSRSSVYFLLNQGFEKNVVKIKATSVDSGETFTAEIPIEKSEIGTKWVHQLAAKAVLGDLESGRSWIHDKGKDGAYSKTKAEVDELAKTEGEKIGIEWNISSKWTSFIVVDEKSLQEKQSRWYQAGNSDLADLTRPRYEPKYPKNVHQGAYIQARRDRSTQMIANGLDMQSVNQEQAMSYLLSAKEHDLVSTKERERTIFRTETRRLKGRKGPRAKDFPTIPGETQRNSRITQPQLRNSAEPPPSTDSYQQGSSDDGVVDERTWRSIKRGSISDLMASSTPLECRLESDSDHSYDLKGDSDSTDDSPGTPSRSRRRSPAPSFELQYSAARPQFHFNACPSSPLSPHIGSDPKSTSPQPRAAPHPGALHRFRSRSRSRSQTLRARRRASPDSYTPTAFQPATELTLTSLLATQDTAGCFELSRALRSLVVEKYQFNTTAIIDAICFPSLLPNTPKRRAWEAIRTRVLDTAMVMVYIEGKHVAEKKLWDLIVQKARAWLEGGIKDEEVRRKVLERLKELLLGRADKKAAAAGEVKGISPIEAGPKDSPGAPGAKGSDGGVHNNSSTPLVAVAKENATRQQEDETPQTEAALENLRGLRQGKQSKEKTKVQEDKKSRSLLSWFRGRW